MLEHPTVWKRNFRLLLIATWVLTSATVFAHFMSRRAWPPELLIWHQAYLRDPQHQPSTARLVVLLLYLAIQLAVTIGLYAFKRWAKTLLIPVSVLGYLLAGASRINIDVEWVVSLKSVLSIAYGMVIALVFFSPLGGEFAARGKG